MISSIINYYLCFQAFLFYHILKYPQKIDFNFSTYKSKLLLARLQSKIPHLKYFVKRKNNDHLYYISQLSKYELRLLSTCLDFKINLNISHLKYFMKPTVKENGGKNLYIISHSKEWFIIFYKDNEIVGMFGKFNNTGDIKVSHICSRCHCQYYLQEMNEYIYVKILYDKFELSGNCETFISKIDL